MSGGSGRHLARPMEASTLRRNGTIGFCEPCQKKRFSTRKMAKAAARQTTPDTPGASRPRAYPCPVALADDTVPDSWHAGHLPAAVRQGVADRRAFQADAERRLEMERNGETHECPGCRKTRVSNEFFACKSCWFALTPATRQDIARTAKLNLLHSRRRIAIAAAMAEWRGTA